MKKLITLFSLVGISTTAMGTEVCKIYFCSNFESSQRVQQVECTMGKTRISKPNLSLVSLIKAMKDENGYDFKQASDSYDTSCSNVIFVKP